MDYQALRNKALEEAKKAAYSVFEKSSASKERKDWDQELVQKSFEAAKEVLFKFVDETEEDELDRAEEKVYEEENARDIARSWYNEAKISSTSSCPSNSALLN